MLPLRHCLAPLVVAAAAPALVARVDAVDDPADDCRLEGAQKYTGYSLRVGTGCTEFLQCINGAVSTINTCPAGTLYTGEVGKGGVCQWASLVECKDPTLPKQKTYSPTADPTEEPTLSPAQADENDSATGPVTTDEDEEDGEDADDNPFDYYCGSDQEEAARLCIPCSSGSFVECDDNRHGCFQGISECRAPSSSKDDDEDDNPEDYYCGSDQDEAARLCVPCSSGSFDDCEDMRHGCFQGISECRAPKDEGDEDDNPDDYYCGSDQEEAARICTPCSSGSFDECDDMRHGCFQGISECRAPTGGVSGGGKAAELASDLRIFVKMGDNYGHSADCSMAAFGRCHTQTLILDYLGDEDYRDSQFKIFFSSIHRVLQVNHRNFDHQHVIGDLTYIAPSSSFVRLRSKRRIVIPIVLENRSVQESDNMPRCFVLDERDGSTAVIENTNTEFIRDFVLPYTSTVESAVDANVPATTANRFALNMELVEEVDATYRIIPAPYYIHTPQNGKVFDIRGIYLDNLRQLDVGRAGATDLLKKLGVKTNGDHKVSFVLGSLPSETAGPESYTLEIKEDGSTITGTDAPGLYYGLMSFIGLLDVSGGGKMALKEMTIYDKPRFEYRGHQVDVARNFRSKDAIMKTIDAMALWKLNVLHLSLTNDEGWRLEIPGLEELTDVGSKRCFDPNEDTCLLTQLGSGPDAEDQQFYTREEYVEILKYAKERNVKILPEFNMPAHARAAVVSMEARARNGDDSYRLTDPEDETYLLTTQFYDRTSIINPCLDSSVRFVEKLVGEVKQMHDDANVPLDSYHFGGDEAKNILLGAGYTSYRDELKQEPFSKSPACQAKVFDDRSFDIEHVAHYWAITVNKILAEHGIREMVAWEDGLRGTTKDQYETQDVAVNFWETLFWGGIDVLRNLADDGLDIIMSNPDYLYFDCPYEVNSEERGYTWAARFNSVYKVFTFAPENLAQNAETSTDRDGNEMSVTTPDTDAPTIRGMQGQTWSETIRTDDQYYEMAFPRMLAVAERAWHRASWELDWSSGATYNLGTGLVPKVELADDYHGFASALGCREAFKIKELGIGYRIPPPGGSIDSEGVLTANSEMPCTAVMYSTNEGSTWSIYLSPVDVGAGRVVYLRSVSSDGTLKSRVVLADEECSKCGESSVSTASDEGSSATGDSSAENIDSDPFTTINNQRPEPPDSEECENCGKSEDSAEAAVSSTVSADSSTESEAYSAENTDRDPSTPQSPDNFVWGNGSTSFRLASQLVNLFITWNFLNSFTI